MKVIEMEELTKEIDSLVIIPAKEEYVNLEARVLQCVFRIKPTILESRREDGTLHVIHGAQCLFLEAQLGHPHGRSLNRCILCIANGEPNLENLALQKIILERTFLDCFQFIEKGRSSIITEEAIRRGIESVKVLTNIDTAATFANTIVISMPDCLLTPEKQLDEAKVLSILTDTGVLDTILGIEGIEKEL